MVDRVPRTHEVPGSSPGHSTTSTQRRYSDKTHVNYPDLTDGASCFIPSARADWSTGSTRRSGDVAQSQALGSRTADRDLTWCIRKNYLNSAFHPRPEGQGSSRGFS